MDFSDQEAQARFLAAASLKHGKKKLGGPVLSSTRTSQEIKEVAALHAATKNMFESKKINLSRKQKKAIRFELVQNVSFTAAKELVGGADRTLRGWRALKQSDVDDMWDDEGPTITADGETTKESDQVDCITLNMYAAFFVKHSGVLSGANRERRTLAMPKHKLLSILFGEIPGMLRELVVSHPHLLQSISSTSRLRRSLEAALAAAKQADFDQTKEVSYRTAMAETIYRQTLDKKRTAACKILPGVAKKPREDQTFSVEQIAKAREIMPIGDYAFWAMLKRAKLKYTTNLKPTICELCDSGVLHVAAADEIQRKRMQNIATMKSLCAHANEEGREINEAEKEAITDCEKQQEILLEEKRKLDPLLNKYAMHKAQYAKCRRVVLKIEEELEPGECLLYRDFVCQYCASGAKMSNLQLVCVYRTKKGAQLRQIQVSNFSLMESNDKYFVADVMDLHLREGGSGVLKKFKKITICGDHGTHFSDIGTIYNESGMSAKYGKEVRIVSLCSYHCYNRCDAAGVHSKKIAKQAAKESKPLKSSRDYTVAVIADNRSDTCAFDFTDINRSANVLGDVVLRKPYPVVTLREQCEIIYVFDGADGMPTHMQGIIRCRPVPDEGKFVLVDLNCERQQWWCQRCTQHYQRPIEHTAPANEGNADYCELELDCAQGDPVIDLHAKQGRERIVGVQFTKKVVAMVKKGVKVASIAIKLKCRHCKKTFAKPRGANKHMAKYHPGVYRAEVEAFLEPPKVKKVNSVGAAAADASADGGDGGAVYKVESDFVPIPSVVPVLTVVPAVVPPAPVLPVPPVGVELVACSEAINSTTGSGTGTVAGGTPTQSACQRKRTMSSSETPNGERKKRRKQEHEIRYGPSSHVCNCDEYSSNFVHLPAAAEGDTPITQETAVWVVDFDEACRLRVIQAVVSSRVTQRAKCYEKNVKQKAAGQLLRFDLGNPSAETWWYAVCDISTTMLDAESRLDAIRNRRYRQGYLEHIGVLPSQDPHPRRAPEAIDGGSSAKADYVSGISNP